MDIGLIIFIAALIIGSIIIYKILKGLLKVVLWIIAIFIAYIILKLFIL